MKLRLGQPVDSLDGHFGVLGDIVIDPVARTVTHLVIEPEHSHRLARLVPTWLVEADDQVVTVQLDAKHVHQLQAAAFADYIAFTDPIDLGDEWDIGAEDVVQTAMAEIDAGLWGGDSRVNVVYDRIPRGEVEIRDRSRVESSDGHEVGHVAGVVTDDELVAGIAVRSGLPSHRRDVLVTLDQVAAVRNDLVALSLTGAEVRKLPRTEAFSDDDASLMATSRELVDAAVERASDAGNRLVNRVKAALHRD